MNKKIIRRILATSISIMILSTTITINGITNMKVYAADNSTNNYEKKIGAGEITGTLKSIEKINYDYDQNGKNKEYLVITVSDTSGVNDSSFFIEKSSDVGKEVEKTIIGQPITVNYVLGTPINFENKAAFPLSSIIQKVKQTTYKDAQGIEYKLDENSKTAIVDSKNDVSGKIIIPEEIVANGGKYSVTSIGDTAFLSCNKLTSIVILNSVISIGRYAFAGCTNLTSIDIPNSVKNIDDKAFYVCSSLKSIKVPNNVTNIGYEAFYGCNSLISVTIPNSLSFIGSNIIDRFNYVNTFIMDENNQNFKTDDGVLFYREKAASALEIWGLDYELEGGHTAPGYGVTCGQLISKKYIDCDYYYSNAKEYLFISLLTDNGCENCFVEKDSDIGKELDKAIIGQHIEMGCPVIPLFQGAAYICSIKIAPTTNTVGTNTVATNTVGTNTVGTNTVATNTVATNTVGTNTVGTNTVATNTVGTNTVATNTVATNTVGTNTVGTNTVATNTVGTNTVATNTVATNTVATNTVATNTVATNTVATNTVGTNTVATNTVGTNTVATNTVATNTVAATPTNSTTTVQEEKQQKQSDTNSETAKSGDLSVVPIVSTVILGSVAMFGARRKRN